MFSGSVTALIGQILLVLLLLGAMVFAVHVVTRARGTGTTLPPLSPDDLATISEALPQLVTQFRVTAPIAQLLPSPAVPPVPLVELRLGKRPLIFTPTDLAKPGALARYEAAAKKDAPPSDVALFALCTLEEGGADAIQERIRDFDKVKDATNVVRLIPAQTQAGDYVVIARIVSHRNDEVSPGVPVIVYRAEVIKNADTGLVMELAVPDENQTPFAPGVMAHGTARLYGYLP